MRRSRCARSALVLLSSCAAGCTVESRAKAAHSIDSTSAVQSASADSVTGAAVAALTRRVYDGFKARDPSAINAMIAESGMSHVDPTGVMRLTSPKGTAEMVKQCAVRSYSMDSVASQVPTPDVVVLTFKLTIDESCGGKRTPSPLYAMSVWHQQGGTWKAIAFSATPARRSLTPAPARERRARR
jgi:hypothetical protein